METPDPDPFASLLMHLSSIIFLGIDLPAIAGIIVFLMLLVVSALVSGSETAFFSLRPADVSELQSMLHPKDKVVTQLREIPKTLLATILILNNLINVSIVILSSYLMLSLFSFGESTLLAFLIQVVVVTSFILLFGEIIPKIYANKRPLPMARLMSGFLELAVYLLKPLSRVLVSSTSFFDKRLAAKSPGITMSELSAAIDITADDTTGPEERKMLKGIASFGEKDARSIMKSRVNITAVEKHSNFPHLIETVLSSGFSRIPVYEESLDKVIGVLYIKDLLPYLNQSELDWIKLIRPAFFVPENKKINDLLQEFRERKIHLAIVVDEYGGTAGLLTLEDIIEEIVGDITDEFDKEPDNSFYKMISPGVYDFEAKTSLVDFSKVLELDDHYFDDVQGDSDTLAGLILELEGSIPVAGAKIRCRDFMFEVTEADPRRIKRLKVSVQNEK